MTPTGNELVALLGAESNDPEVLAALKAFAIRWPPALDERDGVDDPNWYVWRPSSANGFEFGFEDEAHLRAHDPSERGNSPLVLNSVCFYGEHPGVRPFAGEFPFKILLDDSRQTVRAKLSSLEVAPRVHRRDVWDGPKFLITAEHNPTSGMLDALFVILPLAPWPPLPGPSPTLPRVDEIVALFGQTWHSPDMRRLFFPLGLDRCASEIATNRSADLKRAHGIALDFFRDPTRDDENPIKDKGALFSCAKFYRARWLDARGWQGELPCNLEFDLAYPDIVKRVGRVPDASRDAELSGFALWHLPAFTLHVQYDNIINAIHVISIFQPGTWED